MWQGYVAAAMIGLSGGAVAATALAAFIIGLEIIPRYAGITHTAHNILLYEDCLVVGAILGNIFNLYHFPLHLGGWGVVVMGIFSGIFVGSWIIALGEVVNVFAIMARRIGLTKGVGLVVLSLALGKVLGSFFQFFIMNSFT